MNAQRKNAVCAIPPKGWRCSREAGHEGPCAARPVADTYRGWEIRQGRWPEPAWMAVGPNFDASYEGPEDGWVGNGQNADAPTRDALIEEIDDWFDQHEPCDSDGPRMAEPNEDSARGEAGSARAEGIARKEVP